eukprot:TRINITY_DN19658_c0_g1_i1.p1 TRINITY_DN19658_c0_g1~~TRINITY_DN19658_c0_g1_i1.p1  ORF type:complete len:320 (+),score=38.61 TRINITY_DN19658_c0_g1_i1:67-960(+)
MSVTKNGAREMLVAATSAAVAGAITKSMLYPLEMCRMWLISKKSDESVKDVLRQLWRVGVYTGFRMKCVKTVVQKFLYYYLFELTLLVAQRLNRSRGRKESALSIGTLLACGYLGEALGIPCFVPLDYLSSQVQTSKTKEGVVSVIHRTLRSRGVAGFYTGWRVYLLCALNPMVKQTLIEQFRAMVLKGQDRQLAVLGSGQAFWLGAFAQAISGTVVYPINVGRIMLQSAGAREGDDSAGSEGILHVLSRIAREDGIQGLFKGLSTEIAEGMLASSMQLVLKERVTRAVRSVIYAGG